MQKAPEIKHLNKNDLLLAKVVARIQAEKVSQSTVYIPLDKIKLIHPINRDTAKDKLAGRVRALESAKENILKEGKISKELQEKYIPSATWIKVVEMPTGEYVAWEGNGRVAALKEVFEDFQLRVEVEIFELSGTSTVYSDVVALRSTHCL